MIKKLETKERYIYLCVVNPVAGGRDLTEEIKCKFTPVFENVGVEFHIYTTTCPGDFARVVKDFIQHCKESDAHPVILSAGGDGSAHDIAQVIVNTNASMAILGTGTGNDFIKMYGGNKDFLCDPYALLKGIVVPMDVIKVNDVYCLTIASGGFDAESAFKAIQFKRFGKLSYLIAGITEIIYGMKFQMSVEVDGKIYQKDFVLVSACNTEYYGGIFRPDANCKVNDGKFNLHLVEAKGSSRLLNIIQFLKYISRSTPAILSSHIIISDYHKDFNADGERIPSNNGVFDITVIKHGINILVPEGMTLKGCS